MKKAALLLTFVLSFSVSAEPVRGLDPIFTEIQAKLDEISELHGTGKPGQAAVEAKKLRTRVHAYFAKNPRIELPKGCPVDWFGGAWTGHIQCLRSIQLWWGTVPDELHAKVEDFEPRLVAGVFRVKELTKGRPDIDVLDNGTMTMRVTVERVEQGGKGD